MLLEAVEPHHVNVLLAEAAALLSGQVADAGADLDVAAHRAPREQHVRLEHEPLVVAGALDFPAIHEHPAHGGLFKPGDHAEQGGLAALPGAEDDHKLVAPHVDGDVPEHMDLRIPLLNEGLADAFTLDFGFSHDISFRGGAGLHDLPAPRANLLFEGVDAVGTERGDERDEQHPGDDHGRLARVHALHDDETEARAGADEFGGEHAAPRPAQGNLQPGEDGRHGGGEGDFHDFFHAASARHADHIIQFLVDEPDAVVGVEHDGHERADGDDEYLRLLLR